MSVRSVLAISLIMVILGAAILGISVYSVPGLLKPAIGSSSPFDASWYGLQGQTCNGGTASFVNNVWLDRMAANGTNFASCTLQMGGTLYSTSSGGTTVPTGITTVTTTVNFNSRTIAAGNIYQIEVNLYYSIPAITIGATTYTFAEDQVWARNSGGVDQVVGSNAGSYSLTGSRGNALATGATVLVAPVGGTGLVLTQGVAAGCNAVMTAWAQPTTTPCTLIGLEVGTAGVNTPSLSTDWTSYNLGTGPPPPPGSSTIAFTLNPVSSPVNTAVIFTDAISPLPTVIFTVNIIWGDGQTNSIGPIAAGTAHVSSTHVWTTAGTYTVQASVTLTGGTPGPTSSQTETITGTTPPNPPTVTVAAAPTPAMVNTLVTFSGTITNPPSTTFYVVVSWGDATPVGQVAMNPGSTTYSITHTYVTAGTYAVAAYATTQTANGPASQISLTVQPSSGGGGGSNGLPPLPFALPSWAIPAVGTVLLVGGVAGSLEDTVGLVKHGARRGSKRGK